MKHQSLEYRFLDTSLSWSKVPQVELSVYGGACTVAYWYSSLKNEDPVSALVFKHLYRRYVVELRVEDEKVQPYINLNDTFDYACADLEFIEVDEIQPIFKIWSKYKHHGVIAYCAVIKRKADPIKPHITDKYLAAKDEILKHLPMVES